MLQPLRHVSRNAMQSEIVVEFDEPTYLFSEKAAGALLLISVVVLGLMMSRQPNIRFSM